MPRKDHSRKDSPSKDRTRTKRKLSPSAAAHDAAETDEKYQSFIENLPVLFYAVEPEPPYTPIYVSPGFQLFGYPLESWLNDPDIWVRVIHEGDRQRVFAETVDSTNTGKPIQYEYRVVCADGAVMWVRDRGCLIRDPEGKVIHRQGVIADITLNKLAEQEVQKREKLYRTLAKNIPATAVLLFDADLRYTLADGEQLHLHEYSQSMFENRTIWEVFPEELANEWAVLYRRALKGEHISFEVMYQERWLHLNLLPVRDEKNEIFQGMVMWQDITERKRAVEDLEESEARYRNLFENANDIIYVHDLSGNYVSVNKAAERVFGFPREEALKMNLNEIAAPEHLERAKEHLRKKIDGCEEQTSYEMDCFTKDDRRLTLEINSTVMRKDGIPVGVQGIARDVTERKQAERALLESEAKFRTLAETASDAIITIDEDGIISFVNAGTEKIFGYSSDAMLGKELTMLIPERLRNRNPVGLKRYLRSSKRNVPWKAVELPGLHRAGHEIELELSFAEYDKDGRRFFTSVIRDITERKRSEEALKQSESRFRELFENANDLIYTHDLRGQFTSLNRAGELITGYTREEALEISLAEVVAPEYLEYAQQMTKRKLEGELPTSYELEIIAKDGNRVMLELSTRLIVQDGRPVGVQGIGRDITSRRQAEEQLLHNARHDSLTDLPNRTEFMRHLQGAVQNAKDDPNFKFAVLFLDLDRFKIINDSLGHVVGDKLLIGIAKRLMTCVRPRDIVARFGGDEFTVLLNKVIDPKDATMVAERLQRKLSAPFKFGNYEVFTSASIGIMVSDELDRDPEDFLRDADTAMYRAKESGKARCEVFDREMHAANMNLLQVETDLRRAITRQEFEVFYQPIMNLEDDRPMEFEALIRWNHPTHGYIAPNEFISVAEESGLIIPVGQWILEESCRQIRHWQKTLPGYEKLSVSVNLSGKQLMHPALRGQIEDALRNTGLNPRHLKLEVTESTVIERSETALAVLSEMKALGLSLSMDDFGTGYSSLSYLHQFPFERLKIDRSFVDTMDRDAKSEAIVRTILLLGKNLRMEVVAEGIETSQQLSLLRGLNCSLGQGFLFSPPLNAVHAESFLMSRNKTARAMPYDAGGELIEFSNVQ
ncbi:MAG TPA: PAS domain S-box protein [Pyrinomonadaceae bacterium]|nr:PAS domain S-box protein [Pyrinomonadaceae bacterium]